MERHRVIIKGTNQSDDCAFRVGHSLGLDIKREKA